MRIDTGRDPLHQSRPTSRRGRLLLAAAIAAFGIAAAACGGDSGTSSATTTAGSGDTTGAASDPVDLRLGYFANLTHAPAIVGVDQGIFQDHLGPNVTLKTQVFNAGPDVVTAILSDALDISYIGPNPSINGYAQSNGDAVRIIAGSTSGGASLVVKPDITTATDLKGKTLATPQLGNTQDVALRSWLKDNGLTSDTSGGGDVSITPQANADALTAFVNGSIDGAWVPEPWATRMVKEGGGKILVDERDLWPNGEFVTTDIIVRTKFLDEHPDVVKQFLEGHIAAVDFLNADAAAAQTAVNAGLEKLTQKALDESVLADAWTRLTFTVDPLAESLQTSAHHAEDVGLLDPVDLKGIYDLDILNGLLSSAGKPTVSGLA
jgi:NitT/TauT family transport system substrate-binding protein